MKRSKTAALLLGTLLLSLVMAPAWALPMGERQVADFERESLRTLQELMVFPHEQTGDRVTYHLENQVVREITVEQGVITFDGLVSSLRQDLSAGCATFEDFRKVQAVRVEARFRQEDVQEFLDREIQKQKSTRMVFHQVSAVFETGVVAVTGKIDLSKIPGNPLAFLPQDPSSFSARFTLKTAGTQLTIDILEAQVNNQPMTPELKTQILGWLNPLWDFSKLPYETGIEGISFTPGQIAIRGWLFSH